MILQFNWVLLRRFYREINILLSKPIEVSQICQICQIEKTNRSEHDTNPKDSNII